MIPFAEKRPFCWNCNSVFLKEDQDLHKGHRLEFDYTFGSYTKYRPGMEIPPIREDSKSRAVEPDYDFNEPSED